MIDPVLNEILNEIDLPSAYGRFLEPTEPPFVVYMGSGQETFEADDTIYHAQNRHRIEYYFAIKDEDAEADIEAAILKHGRQYEKSEDVYIDSEDIFVIYYYI